MKKIFFAIAIICSTLVCTGQDKLIPIKPYISFGDSLEKQCISDVQSQITQDIEKSKKSVSVITDAELIAAVINHNNRMWERQKAKIGLEKLEYGDWGFYIGDYHFTEYEDIWGDNDLGYNEESYMQEFSNLIPISKSECDALVSALNKKKNCNKNIYYTFKSEGYGENCRIKVFVTYRDKKKEYEAEKKIRMKTIK